MENAFSNHVAKTTQDKILNICEKALEFIDNMGGDTWKDATIEPVEWQSRDGFSSSNLGGYSVTQWYVEGSSTGSYHTTKEREFTEQLSNDAYEAFKRDTGIEGDIPEDRQDELSEYEQSYLDDQATIIEFEAFVISSTGNIQLSLLAHYKDAPYHRSNRAEVIYCKEFTDEEFNATDNALILEQVVKAYQEA